MSIGANIIKDEKPTTGLRIVTVNVTSLSPKIITYMATLAKKYDIVLIQEYHKTKARDMKTGPYDIAGFAPAQRTTSKPKEQIGTHREGLPY